MENIINNKKIVICGPAPYLNNKNFGEKIDNYDLIIRFNKGHQLIKNPKIFGSRTDILYHCLSENKEDGGPITKELIENINKFIVASFPYLEKNDKTSFIYGNKYYINNFLKKIPKEKCHIINKNFYKKIENEIGCRPNTGIIPILDILLNYKPKKLYITGITFFKDGYSNLYRNKIDNKKVTEKNSTKVVLDRMINAGYPKRHNQWLIFKYTREIINKYRNIIELDLELEEILKFNLEEYKKKNNLFKLNNEQIFNHYLLN